MTPIAPPVSNIPHGAFWAKARGGGWHPLDAHLMDVAAVTRVLLAPGTALGHRLDSLTGHPARAEAVRRLAVYAALVHDVGKVHAGFQEQRDGFRNFPRTSHVQRLIVELHLARDLGQARIALQELRSALVSPLAPGEPEAPTPEQWIYEVIAHHGRPFAPGTVMPPEAWRTDWLPSGGRDPRAEALRLVTQALRLSQIEDATPTPSGPLTQLLAGVRSLADWLGSTAEIFPPLCRTVDDPDAYWAEAQRRAAWGLATTGTRRPLPRRIDCRWRSLFPRLAMRPTALQHHVTEGPLPLPGELWVIESDTGSGKTEAALALYARLRDAGVVDGVFFALPTRATASAMRDRIEAFARHVSPEAAASVVLAAGGIPSRLPGLSEIPTDADAQQGESLTRWASESLTRALAGELVVGTIDQALLAALPVRHAHLRLASLGRLLVVVDELHSFDTYMLFILQELVAFIRQAGGIVITMSATLSDGALGRIARLDSRRSLMEASTEPFPSVTVVARNDARRRVALSSSPSRCRHYRTERMGEAAALDRAAQLAAEGARVLVLRNTVQKATDTFAHLAARGGTALFGVPRRPPAPYHARYTDADRVAMDEAVRAGFGLGGTAGAGILVATQVVEQSLDVDFDVLMTDLCPIDVLVQRLGRVHRHARQRPGCSTEPAAIVIAPEVPLLEAAQGRVASLAAAGLGSVYEDLVTLELTLSLLDRDPEFDIPEASRRLIERVYHHEAREALAASDPRWERYLLQQDGKESGERSLAARLRLPLTRHRYGSREMCEAFRMAADEELKVRTRLGDDRVVIPLPIPVRHHFSDAPPAKELAIEWRKLRLQKASDAPPQATIVQEEGPYTIRIGRSRFAYTTLGWVREPAGQ
ncbi:MAG: CRISPR-associated helicase Cas3' [Gemmatimonadales bacterium]|nr:CRISPR-associated helicase Cas3' [Gemmatimonadales bacterium]